MGWRRVKPLRLKGYWIQNLAQEWWISSSHLPGTNTWHSLLLTSLLPTSSSKPYHPPKKLGECIYWVNFVSSMHVGAVLANARQIYLVIEKLAWTLRYLEFWPCIRRSLKTAKKLIKIFVLGCNLSPMVVPVTASHVFKFVYAIYVNPWRNGWICSVPHVLALAFSTWGSRILATRVGWSILRSNVAS